MDRSIGTNINAAVFARIARKRDQRIGYHERGEFRGSIPLHRERARRSVIGPTRGARQVPHAASVPTKLKVVTDLLLPVTTNSTFFLPPPQSLPRFGP